jgi:hypothetical protein
MSKPHILRSIPTSHIFEDPEITAEHVFNCYNNIEWEISLVLEGAGQEEAQRISLRRVREIGTKCGGGECQSPMSDLG